MSKNGKKAEGITVTAVEASSFHRLRVAQVKLVPGKGLVRITGKNGAGKSSLLRAVRAALGGAGQVLNEAVVNESSEDKTGLVRLELSNGFTVTRRFTEQNPKGHLTVMGPDGGKFGQGKLDDFLGALSFDPLAFFDLKEERQREILLSIGSDPDLPAKLKGLRAQRKVKYDQRTPWISKKRAAAQVAKPSGERPAPVDVTAALNRMGQLQAIERQRQDLVRETERAREAATRKAREDIATATLVLKNAEEAREKAERAHQEAVDHVTDLERQLERARALVQARATDMGRSAREERAAQAALERAQSPEAAAAAISDPDLPPDPAAEMAAVKARIGEADAVRESMEPWKAWDKARAEHEEAAMAEQALTDEMELLEQQERDLIGAAGLDIPGLTFDADGAPLLNGRPLSVASGAERSRLAVAVAMAVDPELRICLLDEEANGLDLDALQELDALAKEHGFQIWCCRIGLEGRGEIVVVDGEAFVPEPAAAASATEQTSLV